MGSTNHEISRDTQLCVSLAARPSNIGTRFHNYLYLALDLNYVYKAFAPVNIEQAIGAIRGLPIRGAAVSMPFKEAVIPLVDEIDATASAIEAVNTIVNTDGVLKAYNTDFGAVRDLLRESGWTGSQSVVVLGSGGMAKAVVAAVAELGFADLTVIARNQMTGSALAHKYGGRWQEPGSAIASEVLINATPIGMSGGDEAHSSPLTESEVAGSQLVMDVIAMPVVTPLLELAHRLGKPTISGADIMTRQAVDQFELYTGVRPPADLVQAAQDWARAI